MRGSACIPASRDNFVHDQDTKAARGVACRSGWRYWEHLLRLAEFSKNLACAHKCRRVRNDRRPRWTECGAVAARGAIMVVGRDYLLRLVARLLKDARSTADPREAEELTRRAADIMSVVDALSAPDGDDPTTH